MKKRMDYNDRVIILPSRLEGEVRAPASKSSMQRACAAALLRIGETVIHHPGQSADDSAAINILRRLGAKAERSPSDLSTLVVSSGGVPAWNDDSEPGGWKKSAIRPDGVLEINCGESGLGLRMFAPILALGDRTFRVVGEGSLLKRPIGFFDEVFPQLGVRVVSNDGRLPLEIQGPLQPKDIEIDGSMSSQFLTGLLFAYAGAGASGVAIRVRDLKSKPYIDLTLQVMRHFGWQVENRDNKEFIFSGERKVGEREYTVETDWSGGAFLLVAGAIAGPITVQGLDLRSTQGDKAILDALYDCRAVLNVKEEEIEVGPARGNLEPFLFDATDCPDLFPPLAALAAYCKGTSAIKGVGRLAHKESNRGLTLQEEFGKMGVRIELDGDRMLVHGGGVIKGEVVHSRHDHRIAMACAVAALGAEGAVTIEEAQAIDKSYPDFYRDLQLLSHE